ncbi:MAG: helix-turn-helix domain-containing protein [bacterium]|jgi:DNA-binding XRE family transcriptional regulator|nr:helix-turn-helix domain-containing protein [bacterium]
MSFVGRNIKKIRSMKKLSQMQFAEIFELSRTSVGAYEEERAEPKIDTIISIANYFGLSIDVLLSKELSVNDLYNIDILNKKLSKAHKLPDSAAPIANQGGVPFVSVKKYVEYMVQHKNKDFINNLERVHLPVKMKGTIRAFEMNGSEMEYHQQGLHHGDILMCHQLAKAQLKAGQIVVVVTEQQLETHRITEVTKTSLKLGSDDPNYPELDIPHKKILECWEVKGVFSTYLNPPKVLEEKVMLMERRLQEIEKKLFG